MHNRALGRWRHRCSQAVFAIGFVSTLATTATAQSPSSDPRDTTHAQMQAPFFTAKDAILAGAFAGGTVLMFPLDRHIAAHLQTESNNTILKNGSKGVEVIASPGAYFIGGGLYLVGEIGHWQRVADLGWHGTESVLLADGITYVLKGMAGRARPFVTGGADADDFKLFRGFGDSNNQSFPSGHATSAFAAAAAVTNETTRWWPRSEWIVGPIMYAGATAVGLSRMYHNKHWASDVVLGAAIGTFTGRKVVQYAHGHPHNMLDQIMLRTAVAPLGQGGVAIGVSLPTP
jgi:membrane-associated phospholipid phosphatase